MPVLDRERLEFVLMQLSGMRAEIQGLETRMILLQQALTPALPQVSPDENVGDEPDAATQIHSSLGCWLRDRLSPLLSEISYLLRHSGHLLVDAEPDDSPPEAEAPRPLPNPPPR